MKTIQIQDDVDIKHIKKFYKEIKDALQGDDTEIVLDFDAITGIDASVVQVLSAAKQKARTLDKTIRLKQVNDRIKNILRIAGLIK